MARLNGNAEEIRPLYSVRMRRDEQSTSHLWLIYFLLSDVPIRLPLALSPRPFLLLCHFVVRRDEHRGENVARRSRRSPTTCRKETEKLRNAI